jgi:hypothetical protein
MLAPADNPTTSPSQQTANPTHPTAGKLVSMWSQGRRRFTPYAYPRLRALAITRLAISVFLVGAVLMSHSHDGWAAIPLAGAVLLFAVGSLDMSASRLASRKF